MTDPQESNHWDLLSSELGIIPRPKEEVKPHAPPEPETEDPKARVEIPAPRKKPPRADSVAKPRQPPTDWSRLASELGLEPIEEPPPLAIPEADLALPPPEPAEGSRPAETFAPATNAPEAPEEALRASRDRDVEPTFADLAAFGAGLESPEVGRERVELSAEPEEKTTVRKRRRRRRKPQPAGEEQPAEAAAEETGSPSAEERTGTLDDEPASATQAGDSAVPGGPGGEEESQARSKRRRRHRGSSRKKGALNKDEESAEPGSGGEVAAVPAGAARSPHGPDGAKERKSDAAQGKDADRGKAKTETAPTPAKPGHRSIPSWREAVGLIISANLEARAKNPNGGSSSRGRSGRSRPGRDKPGDKTK
jgi:hypothetical protein